MEQANLLIARRETILSNRLLGTLGIITSPLLLASFSTDAWLADSQYKTVVGNLLQFFYILGWLGSVVGMRRVRATGNGVSSKIAFIVQMIGLILAATLNLKEMIQTQPDETSLFFHVTDAGYPFSHVFMIVVGIMIVRAKVWFGWRRAGALVCGLALPLTMLLGIGVGFAVGIALFGMMTTAGLALFANAVRTDNEGQN